MNYMYLFPDTYCLSSVSVLHGERMCSRYLISLSVRSTGNTGRLSDRIISPDEGVWRAAPALSCPVDHVVSRWAGNTGGVVLDGAQGAVAALRGNPSDHIGDVDGVDLCYVAAVLSLLVEAKTHLVMPVAKFIIISGVLKGPISYKTILKQ